MLLTNSVPPGQQLRQASQGVGPTPPQSTPPASARIAPAEPQAHFTMISTISPGSLAAAYHTLRSAPVAVSGEPAILSGLGVPAALAAYSEVVETD